MVYYVLLVLFTILLLFHAWNYHPQTFRKWPLLNAVNSTTTTTTCQQTSDCDEHHICLNQRCIPKLLSGEDCFPNTGTWTSFFHFGKEFAACTCHNATLMTQKHFGGNCTEPVACQPHGMYNVLTRKCNCFNEYTAFGLSCRKMLALEREHHFPCSFNEISIKNIRPRDGFSSTYLALHTDKKCFKRPCTFDAYSGRSLKNARYEEGVGCICDPTLGQFGVSLNLDYLQGPGYNACASIYSHPLKEPIKVDMFAYFYLMERPPIVFLNYPELDAHKLIKPLRQQTRFGSLQIAQEFPYDYMQTVFRDKLASLTRSHKYYFNMRTSGLTKLLYDHQSKTMEWCRYMTRHMSKHDPYSSRLVQQRAWTFNLLYNFPACYLGKNDQEVPAIYRGRYVLNPLHLTFTEYPEDDRFNGLKLSFDTLSQTWDLDFAPPFNVQDYIQAATKDTVPTFTNKIIENVQLGALLHPNDIKDHKDEFESLQGEREANQEPTFQ